MRRFAIVSVLLICCGIYSINCHGETRQSPDSNWIKQQEEIMPEQSYTEKQFNSAECFDDKVWEIINNKFRDPNFNGVDWEDARKRYRPKAFAAKDHQSFAVIVNQMLGELKTSHTYYYTKWDTLYYTLQVALISGDLQENNITDTSILEKHLPGLYSSQANPHRTRIGVVTKQLNGRHFVTAVLASSPAKRAGIVL